MKKYTKHYIRKIALALSVIMVIISTPYTVMADVYIGGDNNATAGITTYSTFFEVSVEPFPDIMVFDWLIMEWNDFALAEPGDFVSIAVIEDVFVDWSFISDLDIIDYDFENGWFRAVFVMPLGNVTISLNVVPPYPTSIEITTFSLPSGTVGIPYTATLTSTRGAIPITWSVAPNSGNLPPGLYIDDATNRNGIIYGTPTQAGTFTFTIRATDDAGYFDEAQFTITIAPQNGPPIYTSPPALVGWWPDFFDLNDPPQEILLDFFLGSGELAASGIDYVVALVDNEAFWLSYDLNDFTVDFFDALVLDDDDELDGWITIDPDIILDFWWGLVDDFDSLSDIPNSFFFITFAAIFDNDEVDFTDPIPIFFGIPPEMFTVTMEYAFVFDPALVDDPDRTPWYVNRLAAEGEIVHIAAWDDEDNVFDGWEIVYGDVLSIDPTDFQWPDWVSAEFVMPAGNVRIRALYREPPPQQLPPTITTLSLPNGTVGIPYFSNHLAALGTPPITWSVIPGISNWPPGLFLNPATGVISGVPMTAGTFVFTIRAQNVVSHHDRIFSITIAPPPVTPGTFTLTLHAGPNGSVAIGTGTYGSTRTASFAPGATVRISASPDADYRFDRWTTAWGGNFNRYQRQPTFIMPNQNITITANFLEDWEQPFPTGPYAPFPNVPAQPPSIPPPAIPRPPVPPAATPFLPGQFDVGEELVPETIALNISINGFPREMIRQPAVTRAGVTYVPIGELFRILGYVVTWDAEARQASLRRNLRGNYITMVITEGSRTFTINGVGRSLRAPAIIVNDFMMVPFVEILESVGGRTHLDANGTVNIFITR